MKLTNAVQEMEGSSLETLPKQCWPEHQNGFEMHPQQNQTNAVHTAFDENMQGLQSMDFSQLLQSPDLFQGSMTDMLNGIDMHNLDMHLDPNASTIPTSPNNEFNIANPAAHGDLKKPKPKKQRANKTSIESEQDEGEEGVRRKRRRASSTKLNGLTEEEALQRLLPDHLCPNLDIVIIGINPGLTSASVGHHYAGPANHFWKCMYLSGLITEPFTAYDDFKLLKYGIGFTNIVARTTRTSTDLSRKEIKEGSKILQSKIEQFKPKIAVFNGIGIYELFIGRKDFHVGKQPHSFPGVEETAVFVMPSSSARFTQLPRAVDKLPFYLALKKLRDYLNGRIPPPAESEVSFPEANFRIIPKSKRPGYVPEPNAEEKKMQMKKKRVRRFRKDEGEEEEGGGGDTSRDASVSSDFNNSQEELSSVAASAPNAEAPLEPPKERLTPISSLLKIKTESSNEVNDSFTDALLSLGSSLSPTEPSTEAAIKTPEQRASIESAASLKQEDAASSSGIQSPPQINAPFTPNQNGDNVDIWAQVFNSSLGTSLSENIPNDNQSQSAGFTSQGNSPQASGVSSGSVNFNLNPSVSSPPTGHSQTVSGNYGNMAPSYQQSAPNNPMSNTQMGNSMGFMQQGQQQMRFPFGGVGGSPSMQQSFMNTPNQMPYNAQGLPSSTTMPHQSYMSPLSSQHVASPHFMPQRMAHPGMRPTSPPQYMNRSMPHALNPHHPGMQPAQPLPTLANPGVLKHQQMAASAPGRNPGMHPNPHQMTPSGHPTSVHHRNPTTNQTFANQWQGSPSTQGSYSFMPEAARAGGGGGGGASMQQTPTRHPFWDSF